MFKDLPALKCLNLSCVGCLLVLGVSLLPVLLRSPRAAAKLRHLHRKNTWLKVPNSKSCSALGCQAWGRVLPGKKKKLLPPPSPSLLFLFLLRRINYPTLAELEGMRILAPWWGRFQHSRHTLPLSWASLLYLSLQPVCCQLCSAALPLAPSTHV